MSKSNNKNNWYEESNCEKEEIVPKIIRSFPRRSTTEKWILIVIVWVWQIFGIDSDFPTWSYQQTTPSHCKPKFTCQQSQPIESYKNQQACYCQQKIALTIKWKSVTSLLETLYLSRLGTNVCKTLFVRGQITIFKITTKQYLGRLMIFEEWDGVENALFKITAKQCLRILMMLNFDT